MSAFDKLLDAVKNQIANRSQEGGAKSRGGIFGRITDMLGQRTRTRDRGFTNVRPASQDPLGDPADEQGYRRTSGRGPMPSNVRPASEDPYGDPADEMSFRGNRVRPASEDPWGDPADEPRRRR